MLLLSLPDVLVQELLEKKLVSHTLAPTYSPPSKYTHTVLYFPTDIQGNLPAASNLVRLTKTL